MTVRQRCRTDKTRSNLSIDTDMNVFSPAVSHLEEFSGRRIVSVADNKAKFVKLYDANV